MVIQNMINVQMVLVICMLVGFIAGKLKIVTDSGRAEITEIIMTITLPASIISSFVSTAFSPELKTQSITVFILEVFIQSSMIALGSLLFPENGSAKTKENLSDSRLLIPMLPLSECRCSAEFSGTLALFWGRLP